MHRCCSQNTSKTTTCAFLCWLSVCWPVKVYTNQNENNIVCISFFYQWSVQLLAGANHDKLPLITNQWKGYSTTNQKFPSQIVTGWNFFKFEFEFRTVPLFDFGGLVAKIMLNFKSDEQKRSSKLLGCPRLSWKSLANWTILLFKEVCVILSIIFWKVSGSRTCLLFLVSLSDPGIHNENPYSSIGHNENSFFFYCNKSPLCGLIPNNLWHEYWFFTYRSWTTMFTLTIVFLLLFWLWIL